MPKKYIIRGLCLGYALLVAVGSLIDTKKAPRFDFVFEDKIIHFLAYLMLCVFFFLGLKTFRIRRGVKNAVAITLIFGTVLELLQKVVTDHRTFDLFDLLANGLGVLTAALLIRKNKTILVKKLETFM